MFAETMVSSKHCVIVEDNTCLAKLVRRVSRFVRCFTVETHHVTQCNSSRYKAIMKKKKPVVILRTTSTLQIFSLMFLILALQD